MTCSVYRIDLVAVKRYYVTSLRTHTDMSKWLKDKGNKNVIYEIWKHNGIHSRWKWKVKTSRWGRLATPKRSQ